MVRGDSKGGMSSPYSGESASPYSVGIPSPPTVVADFNRPYEAVHYDGPYIQIQKQPQSKFRFRYKSEMVGTHGQLKAECSDKNKAAFPTVKLSKWNNGPAVIRLMLFTAEENVNQRKRHVHELSGKHCDKETGICEVVVDDKCDYTAQFQNLGIIHIAKRDTREIIMRRKREELLTHARLRKPHCSPEEIRRSITQADYKRIDEEADEEAKSMDLNKVVLRFQAFQYDKVIESYRPITLPVDSDVVYNLKNATTGELKIVRMSACSAPCTGGTEIWLLVEKVRRNNVHVKFFELDSNDREVWTAYGEFSDSDVHHQYAIVFKTPRYRFTNLNTAVKVKVQLERPTDRDTSEPLDFTYMPDSLKRSRMHLETALEDGKRQQYHDPPAKKFNFSSYDSQAIDLSNNKFNGRGQEDSLPTPDILEFLAGELASNGNFNVEIPNESPQHMVPSPVNSIDSSNQGLYSPVHPGSIGTPITEFTMTHRQLQVPSPGQQIPHSPQYSMMSPSDQSVGSPQYLSAGDGGGGVGMAHQFADSQSPQYTNSPSPIMMVPSPSYDTNQLLNQQYLQQQQQQQQQMQPMQMQPQDQQQQQQTQMQKQQQQQQLNFQHMVQGLGENLGNQQQPVQMQPQQMMAEFELPPCFNVGNLGQEPNVLDMLDVAVGHLDFGPSIMNELTADYGGKKPADTKKVKKEQPASSGQDVEELAKMVSGVRIDESSRERSTPHSQMDVAFRVAVNAAECLQAYAATGDISPLLTTHRYLLAVQNNQGDTALHTAVSNKNLDAFNKILKACERIKPIDLLNAQNFARETALHQAVRGSEANMVRRLVAVPGCDVSILDAQGNTPLHIAAELQDHCCLEALLTRPVNGARSAITQAINAYNYNGETPLHMAVTSGNFNNVRMLLNAGAQVHLCEHKRGANPLHLCAMFGNHDIANYLISSTPVTIEASLFDGNTALHLAAQARDAEMCRILIRANADPEAKNFLRRRKKVSESEEEEEEETNKKEEEEEEDDDDEDSEEEPDCHTPFDYAADNAEILAILRREFVDEPVVVEQQAVEVEAGTKFPPSNTGLDSGIDISVTDIQSPEAAGDGEDSAGYLSAGVRRRLASHLSGDTWKHLAQLLDLDYMVPCLAREASPASLLLQPDNMKGVTMDKLRGCLEALGLKDCVAVLDDA